MGHDNFPEPAAIEAAGSETDVAVSKPISRFTRWYRSPLFNVIIVGLISFTQPGIWNALNCMNASLPRIQNLAILTHNLQTRVLVASRSHISSMAPIL